MWPSVLTPPDTPTNPGSECFFPCTLAAPRLAESEELAELPAAEVAETTPSLSWSLRSRRHRLSARPTKRLFTPDIKRLLKGWLVRRRDNPYPSRAEKEALSTRTGLTYMQVCNWFANWRRKLRDCGRARPPGDGAGEDDDQGDDGAESWAHLIRQYHALAEDPDTATAQENFSISSSDSIWEERRTCSPGSSCHGLGMSKCSSHPNQNACVSSTTTETAKFSSGRSGTTTPSPTRDVGRCSPRPDVSEDLGDVPAVSAAQPSASTDDLCGSDLPAGSGSTLLLSKWLESAARYQPCGPGGPKPCQRASQRPSGCWGASAAVEHTLAGRHREELDAAEALAFLSSLRFR